MTYIIEGALHDELKRIALLRAPLEAVGLIYPWGEVVELPNGSDSPENSFRLTKQEMVDALGWVDEEDMQYCALWHSHPSGGVGPSRIDLQNKTPFTYHLVVSIVDGDIVPTWY